MIYQEKLKNLQTYLVEIVIAILLVLFFFLIFLGIMNIVFPYGMDLFGLSEKGKPSSLGLLSEQSRSSVHVSSKRGDSLLSQSAGKAFAKIAGLTNSVKSKSSGKIAWTWAKVGMSLYNNDAVQTFDSSKALIKFDDENELEMGDNTLVIIRRIEEDPFLNEKRSLMLIVDGELRGKVVASNKKAVNLEISTPAGIARIQSKDGSSDSVNFKLQVNPDKTATIAVYEGIAEMISGGEVLRIEENQVATISPGEGEHSVTTLPPMPHLYLPADEEVFYYNDLPPKITFSWKIEREVEKYHLVIAKDREFKNIVTEEEVGSLNFNHGNLRAGTYYWKVGAMTGWEEGQFSEAHSFTLLRDKTPPYLSVNFPTEEVTNKIYLLKGITEPGSEIFIDNSKISVGKLGKFSYSINLRKGINVVVIQAIDKAGNVTFKSERIKRTN